MNVPPKQRPELIASKGRVSVADRVAKHMRQRATLDPIPPLDPDVQAVVDACRYDLRRALATFWPEAFTRAFCADHRKIIAGLQVGILQGGHNLAVLWRGGGKTSIGVCAVAWAALYGHRNFLLIVGATQDEADNAVQGIKADFESNPQIEKHFPMVALPFAALDGSPQRCASQRWSEQQPDVAGDRTRIVCKTSELWIPQHGQAGAGTIIAGRGLGAIRGLWRLRMDGKRQRPDFVLLDDPQTRESAQSEEQTNDREKFILGDVLNLAGHNKRLAAYMAATIITKDDLACKFLARRDWRGNRSPLVRAWPGGGDRMPSEGAVAELWTEYRERQEGELRGDCEAGSAATFYADHRAEMEAGAEISDPELFDRDSEVSAVQHAIHKLWEIGEYAFAAEMQNDPHDDRPEADYNLRAKDVMERVNHLPVGVVPDDSVAVVAAIDINKDAATWSVVSGGLLPSWSVMDYGKWRPSGKHALWTRGDKSTIERAIFDAVEGVVNFLRGRVYGQEIMAFAVDAGGEWAETVYAAVKALRPVIKPAKIYAARGLPGDRYETPKTANVLRKRGYLCDLRQRAYARQSIDTILYWDSHCWHMTMQRGFLVPVGANGSVSIYGDRPVSHMKFAEEVAADQLVSTEVVGERVRAKWKVTGPNHSGDTLAMCGALLSTEGVTPDGVSRGRKRPAAGTRKPVAPADPPPADVPSDQERVQQQQKPAEQPTKRIAPRPYRRTPWHLRIG